jgi:hypothetical protein
MWVKLGQEYLNLEQIVRVKFSRGWKNGHEELIAEVEGVLKGELQVFARLRGAESAALHAALQQQVMTPAQVFASSPGATTMEGPLMGHAMANTLHDVKLPVSS